MARNTDLGTSLQPAPTADREPDLEAEHDPEVAHRTSMAGLRREVQKRASGAAATESVHAAAERGVASPTTALPHREAIQASFGSDHDVSQIKAHVGGGTAAAMGANAYASGDHVVFDREPDLHTAAHEAAHVVQQARGVNLYGGVGEAGDTYEQHADAVADRVVAGQSAADLLGAPTTGVSSAGGAVQMDKHKLSDATAAEQQKQHGSAEAASFDGVRTALLAGIMRIDHAAKRIDEIASQTELGEAYATPSVEECRALFDHTQTIVRDLSNHVDGQASSGLTSQLAPEIKKLNGAYDKFAIAWGRAQSWATKHQESLTQNPDWIRQSIVSINSSAGLDFNTADHDKTREKTKDAAVVKEAFESNVEAAKQLTLAVRMSLTTGKDDVVKGDLKKLARHLRELAAELRETDTPVAKKAEKSHVKKLATDVRALEKELADHADFEKVFEAAGGRAALNLITKAVGVK